MRLEQPNDLGLLTNLDFFCPELGGTSEIGQQHFEIAAANLIAIVPLKPGETCQD